MRPGCRSGGGTLGQKKSPSLIHLRRIRELTDSERGHRDHPHGARDDPEIVEKRHALYVDGLERELYRQQIVDVSSLGIVSVEIPVAVRVGIQTPGAAQPDTDRRQDEKRRQKCKREQREDDIKETFSHFV